MTYQFQAQKIEGKALIREHFSQNWLIIPASLDWQKQGVDFLFQSKENGDSYRIKVVSDAIALKSGNAFVEVWAIFPNQRGWAYTCHADYLFYLIPKKRVIYCLKPYKIKTLIESWQKKYPLRKINQTHGILVPLWELEKHGSIIHL